MSQELITRLGDGPFLSDRPLLEAPAPTFVLQIGRQVLQSELSEDDWAPAPGTVNRARFKDFAETTAEWHPSRSHAAARAWTALSQLASNQNYTGLLEFSGPRGMVNRNCQLIMPRDLNLDSLTRFLGQAEIDIADGMAQESGLDGHQNGTQLTGRTLDFLRAFVRHVIETRNDGLEEIGQA